MRKNAIAPIIIKRKKIVIANVNRSGAWKVAYGDFVTAMMAFFLLMWLLSATTEVQRKGIADYFNPKIPISRGAGAGGTGYLPDSSLSGQGSETTQGISAGKNSIEVGSSGVDLVAADAPIFDDILAQDSLGAWLVARLNKNLEIVGLAGHTKIRLTDAGLIVEIFDLPGAPLFSPGTDEPSAVMTDLTRVIAEIFRLAKNGVAINGYTRSRPIVELNNPVWKLSSSRADRARRLLRDGGLPDERVQRVTGFADRKPVAQNPMAPRNNRLELILLRDVAIGR